MFRRPLPAPLPTQPAAFVSAMRRCIARGCGVLFSHHDPNRRRCAACSGLVCSCGRAKTKDAPSCGRRQCAPPAATVTVTPFTSRERKVK